MQIVFHISKNSAYNTIKWYKAGFYLWCTVNSSYGLLVWYKAVSMKTSSKTSKI